MKKNKKIFFWSPLLGHVGTLNAVLHSAESLNRYGGADISIINTFGEFDNLKKNYDKKCTVSPLLS